MKMKSVKKMETPMKRKKRIKKIMVVMMKMMRMTENIPVNLLMVMKKVNQ